LKSSSVRFLKRGNSSEVDFVSHKTCRRISDLKLGRLYNQPYLDCLGALIILLNFILSSFEARLFSSPLLKPTFAPGQVSHSLNTMG